MNNILAFGINYFGHYCTLPPSRMHHELCEDLRRINEDPAGVLFDIAAPRVHGKTTWLELIYVAHEIVHGRRHFITIIGSTPEAATDTLRMLKDELTKNELLARDFPAACGQGSVWRDDEIVTRNDIKIAALGARSRRIRGRKHRERRPDLVIVGDFEDHECLRSKERRDQLHAWLLKHVLKSIGGPAVKADVLVSGTIGHPDSVLARLQSSPEWRSRKYKAITSWAVDLALWSQWAALYHDRSTRAEAAEFYRANEAAMLAGVEVLWPEGDSYLELMKLFVEVGWQVFDGDKQNEAHEPIDTVECGSRRSDQRLERRTGMATRVEFARVDFDRPTQADTFERIELDVPDDGDGAYNGFQVVWDITRRRSDGSASRHLLKGTTDVEEYYLIAATLRQKQIRIGELLWLAVELSTQLRGIDLTLVWNRVARKPELRVVLEHGIASDPQRQLYPGGPT